jgi:hypothetical protein
MKKQYIVPQTEEVNVRLIGSVLAGEPLGGPSDETGVIEAKDQELEWEEEADPTLPRNINLWEE